MVTGSALSLGLRVLPGHAQLCLRQQHTSTTINVLRGSRYKLSHRPATHVQMPQAEKARSTLNSGVEACRILARGVLVSYHNDDADSVVETAAVTLLAAASHHSLFAGS